MNCKIFLISHLLRPFNFTAAKGPIEGGWTYEENTEIGGGGGETTDTNCTRTPMDNWWTRGEDHSIMKKQGPWNLLSYIVGTVVKFDLL